MKPEDAKRLEEIRAGHSLCDGGNDCPECFLLRVIEEQGKELDAVKADERLTWCPECHGIGRDKGCGCCSDRCEACNGEGKDPT